MASKTLECRGCGKELNGDGYRAYDPRTYEPAKWNHYGGFVCSYDCDYHVCLTMQNSFPGAGRVAHLINREFLCSWEQR